jgi:S-adenosylmethionine decarboxylase
VATQGDFELRRVGGEGGVTGVVLLAESHITIHTCPEHRFVALDGLMWGSADPARAVASIARELKAHVGELDVSRRSVAMLKSKQPESR